MTYMQLMGSMPSGPARLGAEPTLWSPLLLLAAIVVFAVAFRLLRDAPDEALDLSEEPAE